MNVVKSSSENPVEVVAHCVCELGENPLWHPKEHRLYWTDISGGRLYYLDPESGEYQQIYEGRPVGGFTFQEDGGLLLFRDRGSIVTLKDGEISELIAQIEGELDSRFNDVIADPVGRVFCGTMSSESHRGRLYRLDPDGALTVLLEDIGCSNGMGFTPGNRGLYYTDSYAGKIYHFDYETQDGSISNRRVFASIPESEGLPDGLTVDSEGHVWSALWDGGAIVRFSPGGELLETLSLPARKITSVTFGGPEFLDLYITSAGGKTREVDGDLAGNLFKMSSTTAGTPEYLSRVQLTA